MYKLDFGHSGFYHFEIAAFFERKTMC